ncbi:MAG: class I SAM-dependent methyltransferase [Bacillota bacterium]|nr:class I SAM-dependent methyltransferase [Thermoanaerobacteraceae bacterium]
MRLIVTTALAAGREAKEQALAFAAELGAVFVPRGRLGLEILMAAAGAEGALVVGRQRVSFLFGGREFSFHPGTAALRIKNLRSGKPDQMIQAMDLRPGDAVLDCTLGLGADAIVASFVAGPEGRVVGVEKVPVVALVVGYGLRHYSFKEDPDVEAAMRRIQVVAADHLDYLRRVPGESFDVVYFDPFFRTPVRGASQLQPLRLLGEKAPLAAEALREAVRVARRRVVVKVRRDAGEPEYRFQRVVGGRHARVAYGIIEK